MGLFGLIDRRFEISQRESTIAREFVAGLTTFGAMSYVLIVNPAILSAAGADTRSLIISTAVASMIATMVMALWANLPLALAPGMGSNVIFAQVVVLKMGVSYPTALTLVFIGALLFIILAVTRIRERLVRGFPDSINIGMQCGIGLLIAYIGMSNGGLIAHAHGQLTFGKLTDGAVLVSFVGLLVTPVLVALRVPAALLVSIIGITICGLFVHGADGALLTQLPSRPLQFPAISKTLLFNFDFRDFVAHFWLLLPVTLYFLLSSFFSATATLIAVTRRAEIIDADGNIPRSRQAYAADGVASVIGAAVGMSTITTYAESATGVEAGGRTGFAAVIVSLLFGASLFAWPLIAAIPAQATAPALVMVGVLMMEGILGLDTTNPETFAPPMLILMVTVITTDLMMGIAIGCFAYTLIVAATRQWSKLTKMILSIDAILIIYVLLAVRVK